MSRQANQKINDFILSNVEERPDSITAATTKVFGISRATANNYLRRLTEAGFLVGEGGKKFRRYKLKPIKSVVKTIPIDANSQEDVIWRQHITPLVRDLNENIRDICNYGFTEIMNNVIDHSSTKNCRFVFERTYTKISLTIRDFGVGVFEKIRKDFNLLDRRHAILELSKGKLTSSEEKHTGEGIFFTSRMFVKR